MKIQLFPLYYLVLICGNPVQAGSGETEPAFDSGLASPLACSGLTFSDMECPDGGSISFPQGKCVTADIAVSGGNGRSGNYSSAMTSCTTQNGCAWTCYKDKHCSSEPAECAGGYTSLSCNCININWSWLIQINGNTMLSWQGYSLKNSACDGIVYFFTDCVNRMIDKCTYDQLGSIAEGTCTNIHTKETCQFTAFDNINFPVPYDDIVCPSCNASQTDFYDPSGFARCIPENVKCFNQCQFDTCINNLPAPDLYGCENPVINQCDVWGEYNTDYGINHVSGTCTNPLLSETCKFEIDCKNGEAGNNCSPDDYFDVNLVTTTVSCSKCTAKQISQGDVSGNGCSPVNCLPDCRDENGGDNTKWIITGSVTGGVLLIAAVTTAAMVIYKCRHRFGYQRLSEH